MKTIAYLLGFGLLLTTPALSADNPVIVHEWGTFTCLQDEKGDAIVGINVDDEPVPSFVSQVAIGAAPQYDSSSAWRNLGLPPYNEGKGWTAGDPRVTMRLETPVIYIYPPKGQEATSVPSLDVQVSFHGGILSQYYPNADFSGLPLLKFPGQPLMDGKFPYIDKVKGITEDTTTSLDWKHVKIGSAEKPIETSDKVWTTPREVSAPILSVKFSDTANAGVSKTYTEAEHFLFYRGVGHLDSPVQTNTTMRARAQTQEAVPNENDFVAISTKKGFLKVFTETWLVDIRADGTCAYESLPPLADQESPSLPKDFHRLVGFTLDRELTFGASKYSADNLTKLKASMQDALVKEGLYPDEASAMLKTWELSYFKSPGLRFFYIVPRAWVDKVLPLKIVGAPTEITRVMVGRIELITDTQKAILAKLAAGPCPDLAAVKKAAHEALEKSKLPADELDAICSGNKPLSDLGISIPPLVQDYLNLGRFRDALIVHEQQLHPSPALAQFIKDNQLAPVTN